MTAIADPTVRPHGLTRPDWLLIGLTWLGLSLFYLVFAHVRDVDDIVRLLQVRDFLNGQGWFDLTQRRIAPPGGVPMHWSRLVDLPIAAAILIARPIVGPLAAEQFALAAVPLLTLGCALALIHRVSLRLASERGMAVLAMLLGGSAAAVFGQLNPGRIDHHGWQIVLALAALNGLLARRTIPGAWTVGIALALWLAISIEGLPLAAAFLAVLGLRWLRGPEERAWLVHASAVLALVSLALWLLTHRLDAAALAPWCDVVTPVHLAVFAWTALGAFAASRLPWRDPARGFALLGAVALGAAAIYLGAAPQCLGGAFNQLDPLVARVWLGTVGEAMPLWSQRPAPALAMAAPAVLGLAALVWRLRQPGAQGGFALMDYLLVLLAATALGCLLIRALSVATALAAPALAWGACEALRRLRAERRPPVRLAWMLLLLIGLAPWLIHLAVLASLRSERLAATAQCDLAGRSSALAALPSGTFLAPFNLGPELLPATPHRILASSHHRAPAAMRDLIAAWMGPAATAHEIVRRRRIDYVALCPDQFEVTEYVRMAPNGFAAQLSHGRVPGWLAPIPVPGPAAPLVWRVVPAR